MSKQDRPPLLTTRSAMILFLGVAAGVLVGVLTAATGVSVVAAVLAGVTAATGAVAFFQTAIYDE